MSNLFEKITELIGWIQIVASPFLIGLIFGALVYFSNQTVLNLIIAIIISLIGLIIGIIWANKKLKSKEGTIGFLSNTKPSDHEKVQHSNKD